MHFWHLEEGSESESESERERERIVRKNDKMCV